jgi:hypothetical protein
MPDVKKWLQILVEIRPTEVQDGRAKPLVFFIPENRLMTVQGNSDD